MTPRKIIYTKDVSEMTGIPVGTLRYYRHLGEGPKSWKLGGRRVAYFEDDVTAWIESQYADAGHSPESA